MAKVRAPLFGLSAAGKLAGALVYFPWKGIKAVREYVVPANPNTAAQQAQRAYMTQAMSDWHAGSWTDPDFTAFRRLANIQPSPMTHVNVYCRFHIQSQIATDTWENIVNLTVSVIGSSNLTITGDIANDRTGVCYYGVTPYALINSQSCTHAAGTYTCAVTGLTSKTGYYFQIRNTAATYAGRTGIGYQVTA